MELANTPYVKEIDSSTQSHNSCHFVDVSKFLVNTPEITIIFIISFVTFLSKDTLESRVAYTSSYC